MTNLETDTSIAVGPNGDSVAIWMDDQSGFVWYSVQTGGAWSAPGSVFVATNPNESAIEPGLAVGPDGTAMVVWVASFSANTKPIRS